MKQRIMKGIAVALSAVLAAFAFVNVIPQKADTVRAANGVSALQMTTSNITGGQASSVYFGNYMQSSDGQGGYNTDPIKWRVLQNANGKLFLFADQNLNAMEYNTAYTSITWEGCTLRTWLNGTSNGQFLNDAFSAGEQAAIAVTSVTNDNNPDYGTNGGNNTSDKVFLLSISEVRNSTYGFTNDGSRVASNTAFAISQNAYNNQGNGIWWLRSPGGDAKDAAFVYIDDYVYTIGYYVNSYYVAVRPAFNLNLSSVIFTSAAAGGKSSGTVGADALTAIAGDYTGTAWKLTLLDDGSTISVGNGHAGFTASRVDSGNVRAGDAITVSYSGAQSGTDEYVSAIIVSASNENLPLYYGRIANNNTSSTGTDITIPADLAAGNYKLKVFAEQYNGEYKTDYVSAFSTISFTVESSSGSTAQPTQPSTPTVSEPEKPQRDYLADLYEMLDAAIAKGGEQTVYWNSGTALPYGIMKKLEDNPQLTLVFSYSYQGRDYKVTIPGESVKANALIPWCGPYYLYDNYGMYGTDSALSVPSALPQLPGLNTERTYTVVPGDTLSGIAFRLGTTVAHLVDANGIANPDVIQVGQLIKY